MNYCEFTGENILGRETKEVLCYNLRPGERFPLRSGMSGVFICKQYGMVVMYIEKKHKIERNT